MERIDKQKIYDNIVTFCSGDEESAKELLVLIQSSVQEAAQAFAQMQLERHANEIAQLVHRLRFSFSVIGSQVLQDQSLAIEESIVAKNIDASLTDTYNAFLHNFEHLHRVLKKEP
jgi:hypothetical protein